MISASANCRLPVQRQAASLAKSTFTKYSRCPQTLVAIGLTASRCFSSTRPTHLRDLFPAPDTPHIQKTPAAWPHKGYTYEEMMAVQTAHRPPNTFGDWAAWKIVCLARYWMDVATGMSQPQKSDKKNPTAIVAEKPLTEAQWSSTHEERQRLDRDAARRELQRKNALVDVHEDVRARMVHENNDHRRSGVFFNSLFIAYLLSPKIVHRFVGYLEEEAVHTYSRAIREMEEGQLPKWSNPDFKIPELAIQYWNMPGGHQTMRDLILYIRADEACHRGVNHTFGNLDYKEDLNPFVSDYKDREVPRPALKPAGFERQDVI